MSGWYGVDLDGTLAHYEYGDLRKHGDLYIGPPIEKMVNRVKKWIDDGMTVKVFTARVSHNHPGDMATIRKAIEDWTEKHIGTRLEVTNVKDYKMIQLWDDRAVEVIPNQGVTIKQIADEHELYLIEIYKYLDQNKKESITDAMYWKKRDGYLTREDLEYKLEKAYQELKATKQELAELKHELYTNVGPKPDASNDEHQR